jgi:hypothetical protein
MQKPESDALAVAQAAFAASLTHLLEHTGINESELGRQVNRRAKEVSQKTINNIANARTNSELGNFAVIADYFDVPLWVMLIPGLPKEMVSGEALKRLNKMIQDYIATDPEDRKHAENIAAAYVKRKMK